jgi:hypothetical protein
MTESAVEDDRVQDGGDIERPGETMVARPPWWAASGVFALAVAMFVNSRGLGNGGWFGASIVPLVVGLAAAIAINPFRTATATPDALTVQTITGAKRLPWADIDDRAVAMLLLSAAGATWSGRRCGAFGGGALSLRGPDRRPLPIVATIGRDYDDPFLWAVLVRLHRERPLTVSILAPGRYRVPSGSRLPDGTTFRVRRAWPNPFRYRATVDGVQHPEAVDGRTARRIIDDAIVPRLQALLDAAVGADRPAVAP